jgi:hypothetical protein
MSSPSRHTMFAVLAALSAGAAAYHVAGALGQLTGDATPRWRHALFIAIDLVGAWYLVRRPLPLLPVFALLVGQQFVSHGGRAIRWWVQSARVDTISIGTLVALSIAFVLLILDARDRSSLVRRIVCPFSATSGGGSRA